MLKRTHHARFPTKSAPHPISTFSHPRLRLQFPNLLTRLRLAHPLRRLRLSRLLRHHSYIPHLLARRRIIAPTHTTFTLANLPDSLPTSPSPSPPRLSQENPLQRQEKEARTHVAQPLGSCIGAPAAASLFVVSLFFRSSIALEASALERVEGSISEPFCETSVCRKEVCLLVGGSAPVAHWEGWSSWEGAAILGRRLIGEGNWRGRC